MMIKRMVCALCAVMLSLSLCACGEKTKSIDMQALENSMVSADKSLPEMKVSGSWDENAEKAFSYISDLEYNKIHGFFLAYAADGMAYEIAVVQLRISPTLPPWPTACASMFSRACRCTRPMSRSRCSAPKAPL